MTKHEAETLIRVILRANEGSLRKSIAVISSELAQTCESLEGDTTSQKLARLERLLSHNLKLIERSFKHSTRRLIATRQTEFGGEDEMVIEARIDSDVLVVDAATSLNCTAPNVRHWIRKLGIKVSQEAKGRRRKQTIKGQDVERIRGLMTKQQPFD